MSIPLDLVLPARNALMNQTGSIQVVSEGEYIIIGADGRNDERGNVQGRLVAFSLEPGKEGTKLWDRTFTRPFASQAGNVTVSLTGIFPEDNVICFESVKLLKRWGVSLETGQQLWESAPEEQNNYYTMIDNYYNGMLLTGGYGGVILAYDIKTGEILWNFTAANIGNESPYGNYPINIFAIADGKIYTLTGEHSITQPMWRGPNIRCLNATNGEEIWNLMGFGANGGAHLTGQYMQMADGKVLGLNYFDNKIYCIGKGSSATTVSAPQLVPALGSSVTLTGTVTDNTPGAGSRNSNDKVDMVLKGTPAISDADMGRWMEYLFMNQAKPTSATGVPVSLDAIDPNGNYVHIGDVTSDINGNYGLEFTPEVPGTYQIWATFAGSKAYGSSDATTYLSIGQAAPTSSPAPTQAPASLADQYLLPATAGIIVAIAIATIVIVLALRKRP
jgi:outer membrane protein assembly factor BamB